MSLTGTFAVVSLTTMALLAVAVTWLVATSLERQAQRDGEQLADVYVSQGVQSKIDLESIGFWRDPDIGSGSGRRVARHRRQVEQRTGARQPVAVHHRRRSHSGRARVTPAAAHRPSTWTGRPGPARHWHRSSTVVDSRHGTHSRGDRPDRLRRPARRQLRLRPGEHPLGDDREVRLAHGADGRGRHRRLRAAGLAAALPHGPPRQRNSPHAGRGERAARAARRVDRSAEPPAAARPSRPGHRVDRALGQAHGADDPRRRPLQGGQRHPGSRPWRRPAEGGGPAAL